jgi:hypothetical protein
MTREALRMSAGALVWAAHFAVIYGFTALACARGFVSAVPWVTGGATLVALGIAALVMVSAWRERERFTPWMAASIAALAMLAIVYESLALLMVPACR